MQKIFRSPLSTFACAACAALAMLGCTPKYDWREVRSTDAQFTILMPAKPTTLARPINLDGVQVTMTMTAAEVDGVTFAVGSVQLPDAAAAQAALSKMKTALVKNINGSIKHEKPSAKSEPVPTIDIEADGNRNGQPYLLVARFAAKDKRAYQVIVVGREKAVSREAADTFLASFKLN
jgi:hypothetical protein